MTTRNIPRNQVAGQEAMRHSLSSGAYFAASYESTHKPSTQDDTLTLERNMQRVTPAQSRRIRHEKPVKVSVYADMIKISVPDELNGKVSRRTDFAGGGIRGNISGFSRASRKRMIEMMAKIRNTGHMIFTTLTYPDHCPHNDDGQWQRDFEMFRKRFQRAYPTYKAIWRIELVARKSGDYAGVFCPHYHMIVFTGEKVDETAQAEKTLDFWTWCSNNWFEIANCEDERHLYYGVDCSALKSRKHAYAYVSKYVAKSAADNMEIGRRWGRIGKFQCGASEVFTLTDVGYIELRRLIRKWLKRRSGHYSKRLRRIPVSCGMSVFGLGDTPIDGGIIELMHPAFQFIDAARSYAVERGERERSYGD